MPCEAQLLDDIFKADDVGRLRELLASCRSEDCADESAMLLLHRAGDWGASDCTRELLAAGADVALRNELGQTPLHRAACCVFSWGRRNRCDTCVALLLIENTYYIMNIGDSRIYLISDNIYQMTKDQTYVQREMDAGRMTYEESLRDPQRNVLLQCIGASPSIEPDFFMGDLQVNQCYMLCCDGFRHVIDPQEFFQFLNPSVANDPAVMQQNLVYLTELNKQRNETDNITAVLIRTY